MAEPKESPSFVYRTVAHLLGINKNTVQRVFQCKGWQVRKRPRASGLAPNDASLVKAPNERWAIDLCWVWAGKDGRVRSGAGFDCTIWLPGQNANAFLAAIRQWLGLRHSQLHGACQKLWLQQVFITPDTPEQNEMVERVICRLKGNACIATALRPCNTPASH